MTSKWSQPGKAAVSYADLIFHRARDGMLIDDWRIDWEREPLTHSFYPTADVFQLGLPDEGSSVVTGEPDCSAVRIGDLLHLTYGLVSQRLTINRNDSPVVYQKARWAKWGRTTASGGGRYCVDLYLVESGRGERPDGNPLPPGIYHYTPLRHAYERIGGDDATDRLATLQGYRETADRYLVMTINYWRSGFKYNDFAYQATAMDVGTAMATMAEIEGDRTRGTWDMWPHDHAVAELLGLDPARDGVYAIQAWGGSRPSTEGGPVARPVLERVTSSDPTVVDFATTLAMQRDVASFPGRPEPFAAVRPVRGAPEHRNSDWARTLYGRQSSFGRFTGGSYSRAALLALLRRADDVGSQVAVSGVRWMYLVYVSAVAGAEPGLYRYIPGAEDIELIRGGHQDEFLASTYFLKNYDGRRAAATIVPCANVYELSEKWGVRGYRLVNAVVGSLCQAISTEAVRHGLGTGTALGFDTAAHAERAGLDASVMAPMLMIMTGVDDPLSGCFHSIGGARLVKV